MSSDFQNCPIDRSERACRTCRHYDFFNDRIQDEHGTCRRHAPQPRLTNEESPTTLFYADWPLVRWNEHCGEWQWDETLEEWIDNPDETPKAEQGAAGDRP